MDTEKLPTCARCGNELSIGCVREGEPYCHSCREIVYPQFVGPAKPVRSANRIHLENEVMRLQGIINEQELKIASLTGQLQAYEILDSAGRIDRS